MGDNLEEGKVKIGEQLGKERCMPKTSSQYEHGKKGTESQERS